MAHLLRRLLALLVALGLAVFFLAACSSGQKKTTPELSRLEGKKVALVDIQGEVTARKVVEIALVNQLMTRGTFILISKQDLEAARSAPNQDPTDWQGIARGAGADFALRAKVLQFDADIRDGYSEQEVEDSQLAAERGEDARKTKRLYKVKSLDGQVKVQLEFTDLSSTETRTGIAEATDRVVSEGNQSAIHLPPQLRFLENLSNDAFRKFFENYN